MGATYTRQSTYSDGDVITAAHTNDEFNQLLAAFQASTGHTHDGTANEGGPITKLLGNTLTFGAGTAGTDITITFDGETSDGVFMWMEDEDHFKFMDDVVIDGTKRLYFNDEGGEYLHGDGTDLNIVAGADINIPANVGLTFGDDGEKIEGDGTDLTITGNNINLTATADVNIPSGVGITFATAEKIESDGTDLSITVGSGGDINIPADIGLTFGNDGEKIEGDGTDLTITGNNINLTGTADVIIPANVGLILDGSGAEKIESDGTDINFSVGSSGDINIPANIGLTFGNDGEKIEGDGTDLTITGNNINLTATADVVIPADVGITFGTGEKIEGDNTDLTITSGAKINLTATSDIHVPNNVGIVFGGDSEKIEGDGTDMTISSNNLTVDAAGDIVLDAGGANITFKDDGTSILDIANNSSDVELTVSVADKNFAIKGTDGSSAITALDIDMALAGKATFSGDVVVTGDLTVTGDDLTMGTNTSGHIMVADGTNFNPVAVSGDVTISSAGAVTIANGAVETAMVNANVITGQTAETSLDTSNDVILIHDASASALRKTTLASISSALGGITDVVADTSPQLGGNLDTNSHNILIDNDHFIADENGNEQIIFNTTSSAVNQFEVTNSATGNSPELSATGGDTNISLKITPKGSGQVLLDGNVGIESGTIDLKNSGSRSKINFYCESGNAHAQALQAAPHSASASNTLTLPSTGGDVDLVSTASTATLTNKSIDSDNNTITNIVNADIKSSAAIADTKLATISTAGKVALSALEIDGGTDIGANLVDADLLIVDDGAGGTNRKTAMSRVATYIEGGISGDITISSGTAAIGSGVIVNADVNASAALEFSKMENITASRALVSDSNGDVSAATTTSTEIGYVNGVTSAIQTQLDAKASKGFATAMAIAL